MARIRPQAKLALIVVGGLVFIFGVRISMQKGLIPTPGILKSAVALKADLPSQTEAQVSNVKAAPYPSTSVAGVSANRIPFDIWEWNAYFALLYANGGPETTRGSLMEKYKVNLTLKREDANTQMKADLLACAKQLHDGEKTCSPGAAAIVVMGDGGAQWFADLNPQLKKFGAEYQLVEIGAVGRSNGEDALLGPAEWKANPQSMKGKTVVGVLRDGDWNIALKYEGDNNVKNNPDPTTWDADAVNWIAAPDDDYIKAVTEVYIPNRCEPRKVVKDAHLTGETKQICPDGVVTWYPGDEQAIHGRAGTAKVVSSREYRSQMPSTVIGIKKFFNDNRDEVNGLLAATFEAADQIKAFDAARRKAGEISARVYKDQNADYWYKAFSGYTDPGTNQPIGGSAVFNLEDNINFFGLDGKHNNNMRATYSIFGSIAAQQYPNLFKDNPIPEYKEIADTSFILGAQSLLNTGGVTSGDADAVDFSKQAQSTNVVAKEAIYINFAVGSAKPLPDGIAELDRLKNSLAITGLAVRIDGFTDNTGSADINRSLSEERARAVKAYLQAKASLDFPDSRFASVEGHGPDNPIGDNATSAGKARNRRVEITQIGQ